MEVAGQRVQVIMPDKQKTGKLQFGTEVVTASDGSLAAVLGASPGASTSVSIMLGVLATRVRRAVARLDAQAERDDSVVRPLDRRRRGTLRDGAPRNGRDAAHRRRPDPARALDDAVGSGAEVRRDAVRTSDGRRFRASPLRGGHLAADAARRRRGDIGIRVSQRSAPQTFARSRRSHRLRRVRRSLFGDLRWRSIGPFRGGRTVAIAGVPQRPETFYMAPNDGGVWKSIDAGRTWLPIFDAEPTGSIGALAVAPSDPNVVYAGSGEGLRRPDLSTGDGMYVSTDGGATWTHGGLRDAQQIQAIAVDPRDAKIGVRRRRGASVRTERRTRPLSHHGRRRELCACARRRCRYGRRRRRDRPGATEDRLRGVVGVAQRPVESYRRLPALREERPLQVDRRRHVVDEADGRITGARRSHRRDDLACRSSPALRGRRRSRTAAASTARTTPALRGGRRTAKSAFAGGPKISPASRRTRAIATSRMPRIPRHGVRPTAARRGPRSKARRAATTITPCGSTRRTRASSRSASIKARRSPSTAARPGAAGTTSRRGSSTTSSRTTAFRIASSARNRRAAAPKFRAAATTERSRFATSIRSASRNTATSRRTRCIRG